MVDVDSAGAGPRGSLRVPLIVPASLKVHGDQSLDHLFKVFFPQMFGSNGEASEWVRDLFPTVVEPVGLLNSSEQGLATEACDEFREGFLSVIFVLHHHVIEGVSSQNRFESGDEV